MNLSRRVIARALAVATLLFVAAIVSVGQTTTGTVSMSATVSKFVEINSGGAVTLSGNSGGGITTDGVANNPLAVSINLGELGPSNSNSFVTASVPLKLRSNAAYVLSMSATVTSTGTTSNKIGAADVGFGLGSVTRSGTGVNTAGPDTHATPGDPTFAAKGSGNGARWPFGFPAVQANLNALSFPTAELNAPLILEP